MARRYGLTEKGRASRAAQREKTRQALLQTARKLFEERGYDGVSVTEIGRAAGVSHTLINSYFDGKAGLLYALVEDTNAPQLKATEAVVESSGPAPDRLRRVLMVWAKEDLADPRALQVMQAFSWEWNRETEERNRETRRVFVALVERLVREGRDSGEIPPGASPRVVGEAIFAIYTWGLREAVFNDLDAAAAVDGLWPQVQALLRLEDRAS
jgi:AcrR family transcriptional regulator